MSDATFVCPECHKVVTTLLRPGRATLLCEHCKANLMTHLLYLYIIDSDLVEKIPVKRIPPV